jgi:hypothetical protein
VAWASVDAARGGAVGGYVTLYIVRFAAFATAFMLSRGQARFFDCNKMPVLSTLSGTVTLLIVYALGEALYRVASSEQPREAKVGAAVKLTLIGGAATVAAGFFTMMTHLCP